MEHTQAERWSEAAAAFEQALELRAAATIRYNLAVALDELGRHREAQAQLDAMAADPETSAELRELAAELRTQMRAAAGRISVERSTEVADATVVLDGEPLEETELRGQILVAPGAHRIEASRRGEVVATTEVSAVAGEHTRVVLGLASATSPDDPDEPGPLYEEWYFWAGIGGGAILLAVIVGVSVGVATAQDGGMIVEGDFSPGVITWP